MLAVEELNFSNLLRRGLYPIPPLPGPGRPLRLMPVNSFWLGRGMDLKQKGVDGVTLATAPGRIDLYNADDFTAALSAALADSKIALILDFSDVEYISSAGFRSLLITFKASKTGNKGFAVAALTPTIKEIFDIARFSQALPIFQTTREAVAQLAPDALARFDAG
jgi:anti-anti-sigma factor